MQLSDRYVRKNTAVQRIKLLVGWKHPERMLLEQVVERLCQTIITWQALAFAGGERADASARETAQGRTQHCSQGALALADAMGMSSKEGRSEGELTSRSQPQNWAGQAEDCLH